MQWIQRQSHIKPRYKTVRQSTITPRSSTKWKTHPGASAVMLTYVCNFAHSQRSLSYKHIFLSDNLGSEWKWGVCQKDNNPTMKNIQLKAIRRSSMNGEVNPHQRMVYNWPLITNTSRCSSVSIFGICFNMTQVIANFSVYSLIKWRNSIYTMEESQQEYEIKTRRKT